MMVFCRAYSNTPRCNCWKNKSRWARKAFHRENARRALKNKPPLAKPVKCNCGGTI